MKKVFVVVFLLTTLTSCTSYTSIYPKYKYDIKYHLCSDEKKELSMSFTSGGVETKPYLDDDKVFHLPPSVVINDKNFTQYWGGMKDVCKVDISKELVGHALFQSSYHLIPYDFSDTD